MNIELVNFSHKIQKEIENKIFEVERSIENSKDGSLINRVIGQSQGLNMALEIIKGV